MAGHKWAPPEHQDVPIYAAASIPLHAVGTIKAADPPQPVITDRLTFERIGELTRVMAFAVVRSDTAVYAAIAWQGRLQRPWIPRDTVTIRKLAPRRD